MSKRPTSAVADAPAAATGDNLERLLAEPFSAAAAAPFTGGIKIGTVTDQKLDPKTFQAIVRMNIANDVQLPLDTSAKLVSESLLGGLSLVGVYLSVAGALSLVALWALGARDQHAH